MLMLMFEKFKKITMDVRQMHMSAYAAQVSFYFIMSLFPMMILVFSILDFFAINPDDMHVFSSIGSFELHEKVPRIPIISFGTLLAAWSSGKTFGALRECFRFILNNNLSSGYIRRRIRGVVISFLFSLLISLIIIIAIFGTEITNIVLSKYCQYIEYFNVIQLIRKLFVVISLFLITLCIYRFLPEWNLDTHNQKIIPKRKHIVAVSLIASAVIYIYTVFFSLYMNEYSNMNVIYNDAASLVSFMLLTYGITFVFIIGFRILALKSNYCF